MWVLISKWKYTDSPKVVKSVRVSCNLFTFIRLLFCLFNCMPQLQPLNCFQAIICLNNDFSTIWVQLDLIASRIILDSASMAADSYLVLNSSWQQQRGIAVTCAGVSGSWCHTIVADTLNGNTACWEERGITGGTVESSRRGLRKFRRMVSMGVIDNHHQIWLREFDAHRERNTVDVKEWGVDRWSRKVEFR